MRLVLTGATGFLGGHLLQHLVSLGHECRVLTRSGSKPSGPVPSRALEFRQVDWSSQQDLDTAIEGADGVINLIGILNERGWGGRGFRAAHVTPVKQLIAACEAAGISRFVQVSAINAGRGKSHYLLSKGEAEALLRSAPGIDETILRPAVIFGEGDSFFNRFAGLLRFVPILPLACPDSRMQPVWVGDVVAAIGICLDHRATIGQTLDIVGPQVFTLKELVIKTAEFKKWNRHIVGLPAWLARIQAALMDFVPGKPFSSDNYRSLQLDSVSQNNALPSLGIQPRRIDTVVPAYLSPRDRITS